MKCSVNLARLALLILLSLSLFSMPANAQAAVDKTNTSC